MCKNREKLHIFICLYIFKETEQIYKKLSTGRKIGTWAMEDVLVA